MFVEIHGLLHLLGSRAGSESAAAEAAASRQAVADVDTVLDAAAEADAAREAAEAALADAAAMAAQLAKEQRARKQVCAVGFWLGERAWTGSQGGFNAKPSMVLQHSIRTICCTDRSPNNGLGTLGRAYRSCSLRCHRAMHQHNVLHIHSHVMHCSVFKRETLRQSVQCLRP